MDYKNSPKATEITMELPNTIEGCHTLIRSYHEIITTLSDRIDKLEPVPFPLFFSNAHISNLSDRTKIAA